MSSCRGKKTQQSNNNAVRLLCQSLLKVCIDFLLNVKISDSIPQNNPGNTLKNKMYLYVVLFNENQWNLDLVRNIRVFKKPLDSLHEITYFDLAVLIDYLDLNSLYVF